MTLLQWCTLEPSGSSQLAAIRFSSPVQVRSVRIFPKGAQPFVQQPEIISETEPEAFFLDVFFNAHPTVSTDPKQKQKASNALIPSTMAYPGGYVDFTIEMGDEYATRLMIVKGAFTKVSMAIYGNIVSDAPPEELPPSYTPSSLPTIEPTPLAPAIDPANSEDPTQLARRLLDLIPDAPPLALVIPLMFCIKPSNEHWDLPEFPYLYADLDEDVMDFDLERACELTSTPVADDASYEMLQRFADRVADAVGPKDSDQAYFMARLLSNSASQNPELARVLLDRLDLRAIFDSKTMDEDTLTRLLAASSNPDIARHLKSMELIEQLTAIYQAPSAPSATKTIAKQLVDRLHGWDILVDSLWNTQGDFASASSFLRVASSKEASFGMVLQAFVLHTEVVTRLTENPVIRGSTASPPALLVETDMFKIQPSVSHDEFISFMRAFVGVSSVVAVYAWADSLPHWECRERVLSILRAWQGVKGYREIVNHLMLLPQMVSRLEVMMDPRDEPTRSALHAERILLDIARSPSALLSENLTNCLLDLHPDLSVINEEECQMLYALANLTDRGLPGAMDELLLPLQSPVDAQSVRTLRVALAIVARELSQGEEGEWAALNALWERQGHGLGMHLVDTLSSISQDLSGLFTLQTPRRLSQAFVADLFSAADEALRVIQRLVPVYPLPGRQLRTLTGGLADLFGSTDAADMIYAQGSDACSAAQSARQACIDVVRVAAGSQRDAEVVLRTLLLHGAKPGDRDPAYHLLHVFSLIDHLLPMPQRDMEMRDVQEEEAIAVWIKQVVPRVLNDLTAFFRMLDPENRAHLVRRLADLDEGVIGVAEWLIGEEIKMLKLAVRNLASATSDDDLRTLREYQVSFSLRLLSDLMAGPSGATTLAQTLAAFVGGGSPEAAGSMTVILNTLLASRSFSPLLFSVCEAIILDPANLDPGLSFALALTFLRAVQCPATEDDEEVSVPLASSLSYALQALQVTPIRTINPDRLCFELCDALIRLSTPVPDSMDDSTLTEGEAEIVLSILQWLVQQSHAGLPQLTTLSKISSDTLTRLFTSLEAVLLTPTHAEALDDMRQNLNASITPDDPPIHPLHILSGSSSPNLHITLHALDTVIRSTFPVPSTPPPKRTTPPQYSQNMLGLVMVSPPTALLRSPAVTGLTKTYGGNDFRQLRAVPSARLNTSRLPSTHVDAFDPSPPLLPGPLPGLQLNPFGADPSAMGGLGAPFGTQ